MAYYTSFESFCEALKISNFRNFKPLITFEDITFECECEFADNNYDDIEPKGCINDFTNATELSMRMIKYFKKRGKDPRRLLLLDLGTATGTVPLSCVAADISGLGIEGSSHPKCNKVGAWGVMPSIVRNADISKKISLYLKRTFKPVKFDIIWSSDVFEHIQEDRLEVLFDNITRHLSKDGFLISTIATIKDGKYHHTVKNRFWWRRFVNKNTGLKVIKPVKELAAYPRTHPFRSGFVLWAKLKD